MIETFTALVFAHVLADFVFQTGRMAAGKRRPAMLLLHGAIVLAAAQAATGQVAAPELLALAAAHVVIDAVKARAAPGLGPFLADQAAHLATILAITLAAPHLWATGALAPFPALPPLMAAAAGLILATRAGGFAVGLLMAPLSAAAPPEGLPKGGLTIGLLERGLIFLLVLSGQPAAIGFLIAAKSILRFGAVAENRAASEYVIIGTLASFGWAIAVSLAAAELLALLPPLAVAPAAP